MKSCLTTSFVALLAIVSIAKAQPNPTYYYCKVLDVPPALEFGGSYPTAMAMVLLSHNEYLELFPEHIIDFGNQEAMNLIASPEYFADYYSPDDSRAGKTLTDQSGEPGHQSNHHLLRPGNCVADWTQTSQSYLLMRAGQSWVSEENPYYMETTTHWGGMQTTRKVESSQESTIAALSREVNSRKAENTLPVSIRMIRYDSDIPESDFWWHTIIAHIEDGQPVVALRDHFRYAHVFESGQARVIIGYAVGSGRRKVLVHDTQNNVVVWESFPTHQEPPPPPEPTGDPVQDIWNEADYRADLLQGSWYDPYGSDFDLDALVTIDVGAYTPRLRQDAMHRLFHRESGTYFHTANPAEAELILADETMGWKYHGPVFKSEYAPDGENSPVFRLYDKQAGVHFYTIDSAEKDTLLADFPDRYSLDGVAFYARTEMPPVGVGNATGYRPVWRCYLPSSQSYYFTASQLEYYYLRDHVSPDLIRVEGVAWYSRGPWAVN